MKSLQLFFVISCLFISLQYQSQIKVNSNGSVSVGNSTSGNLYVRSSTTQSTWSHKHQGDYGYIYESLGVGTNYSEWGSPYALDVQGSVRFTSAVKITGSLKVNGTTINSSDFRIKKNIRNINSNKLFEKLSNIKGKKYRYKNKKELRELHNSGVLKFDIDTIYKKKKSVNQFGDTVRQLTNEIKRIRINGPNYSRGLKYGVIAQDVESQFPNLVSIDEKTGVMGVDYNGFIPILIEGINLQQEKITQMSKQLKKLKREIDSIKTGSK